MSAFTADKAGKATSATSRAGLDPAREARIEALLSRMTLVQKAGQLTQINGHHGHVTDDLRGMLRAGLLGSVINEVKVDVVNEIQRIAVEESELGIPLLMGRDVIHGFKTIFPIPLAQASSWNPEVVRKGAHISALEAARAGVNWTFAPMVDIARDPRWGRVAESLGEDPYLGSVLSEAMVRGFQGNDLGGTGSIAACAKHFAGYGASEAGKDYNATNIPERELREVHLPPFRAACDAGVATFMSSFSDLDGIPASGNHFLMTQVLREEWGFTGFVVSDWESIPQLCVHGLCEDRKDAALTGATAGVDMDMAGFTYLDFIEELVEEGKLDEARVDEMVRAVLRVKFDLGLFDDPYTNPDLYPAWGQKEHLDAAREAARQSMVLLKNEGHLLPLEADELSRVAVIGPLADEPREQLGTWIFDGDPTLSQTPLRALRKELEGRAEVEYVRAMETGRSYSTEWFDEAEEAAARADVAILFVGEEAILSGEAHCRADIRLPGAQEELLERVAATGTPTVVVLMTGRPLALESVMECMDALLCAWHPGTMAGPAIVDLLFGAVSPSGKLPVTFPRVTGQVPIYYGHKNTGRPPTEDSFIHIDEIPAGVPQLSVGNTSFHLDTHYTPLFPFGFGLSYGHFEYEDIRMDADEAGVDDTLIFRVYLRNLGQRAATEVVQLYVRDPVASATRPVRELKAFKRVHLAPDESTEVVLELPVSRLAFHGRDMQKKVEPGRFDAWIGGSSRAWLHKEFHVVSPD
jgi:beta-glucosidase